MRPILVSKTRGTGAPAVFALTMDNIVQIGNSPAVAVEGTFTTGNFDTKRVVFFKGNLYWLIRDTVRKYNRSTGDWDVVYTISDINTNLNAKTGLYIFTRSGKQYLGFAYTTTTVTIARIVYSLNGDDWIPTNTSLDVLAIADASNAGSREVFFNNKIFCINDTTPGGTLVDFDTMGVGLITFATANTGTMRSLFIYNNMIMSIMQNSTGVPYINIMFGGVDRLVFNINSSGTGFSASGECCAWVEDDVVYGIYWANSAWRVGQWKIGTENSYQVDFLTNVELSSILPRTYANTTTFRVVYDNNVAPGEKPAIYIAAGDIVEGTVLDWYRWRGPNTELESYGAIGSSALALPDSNQNGGGEYFWEENRVDIGLEKLTRGSAKNLGKLHFRLYESSTIPSGTLAHVGFLAKRSSNWEAPPASGFITGLVNPSVGTVSPNGKIIIGVPFGSGELHTVEWNGSTDGVRNRTGVSIVPYVSGII